MAIVLLGNFFGSFSLQACGVVKLSSDLVCVSTKALEVALLVCFGPNRGAWSEERLGICLASGNLREGKGFVWTRPRGRPERSAHGGTLPCRFTFAAPGPCAATVRDVA